MSSSTGLNPDEFDDDRDDAVPVEDPRALGDAKAPHGMPDWLQSEMEDQPDWSSARGWRLRWYFLVYSAEGIRVGQLHVNAESADDARQEALGRIEPGQLLSAPACWGPAGAF